MSETTSGARPAPCCGEIVDVDDVLDREECPRCETSLGEMFRLARSR